MLSQAPATITSAVSTDSRGRDPGNGHHLLGVQVTPIATRGNHQFRLGVFVPLVWRDPAGHADFPDEVRFAFETFF